MKIISTKIKKIKVSTGADLTLISGTLSIVPIIPYSSENSFIANDISSLSLTPYSSSTIISTNVVSTIPILYGTP